MRERIEKIKTHLRENKAAYISGAGCLTVGVVGGILVTRHNLAMQSSMTRIFSPGNNNLVQIYLAPLGDPGNVVQCLESGSTYASQGELARTLGISPVAVSKHMRGLISNLNGKHYAVIGKAGQPIAAQTST